MSVTLEFDEDALASLPLRPGERGIPCQYGLRVADVLAELLHVRLIERVQFRFLAPSSMDCLGASATSLPTC